jgi:DNA-binding transcriptional ArsR family regulator
LRHWLIRCACGCSGISERRTVACVKVLVGRIGLAQSTVSQHLKVLVDAELVRFRADRQSSRYTVNSGALRELAAIIGTTLDRCNLWPYMWPYRPTGNPRT